MRAAREGLFFLLSVFTGPVHFLKYYDKCNFWFDIPNCICYDEIG